ncbi:MAG: RDD family protein [Anaerolineae bacterium]|nr:RDD family protein [Anaerolineae bacterium]
MSVYTTTDRADFGARFLAIVIDGFVLGLIAGLLFGAGREAGGIISFVVGLVYNWYFWTRQEGQTPGKRIMHLRVVKTDGSAINDTDAIIRYIGYYINTAVLMLGWLWALIDERGQGLHDKIAGTMVVRA